MSLFQALYFHVYTQFEIVQKTCTQLKNQHFLYCKWYLTKFFWFQFLSCYNDNKRSVEFARWYPGKTFDTLLARRKGMPCISPWKLVRSQLLHSQEHPVHTGIGHHPWKGNLARSTDKSGKISISQSCSSLFIKIFRKLGQCLKIFLLNGNFIVCKKNVFHPKKGHNFKSNSFVNSDKFV